jgi:hypothetical protein
VSLAATVQRTAIKALKSYGAAGTLSHIDTGGYDPATGTTTGAVTTVTPCSAMLDSSSLKTLGFKFGDGLVQGGDMMATLAGIVPAAGDILTINSGPYAAPYNVIAVQPQFIGSDVPMVVCLVRK